MEDKATNRFEYQGGIDDGKILPYKISDLVINSNSILAAGKNDREIRGVRIRRENTQLKPFNNGREQ